MSIAALTRPPRHIEAPKPHATTHRIPLQLKRVLGLLSNIIGLELPLCRQVAQVPGNRRNAVL